MRSTEVADRAKITYRQLDWWIRKGYVKARSQKKGSGNTRSFTLDEARVVVRAARLVRAGLSPEYAVDYARIMIKEDTTSVEFCGVLIEVMPSAIEEELRQAVGDEANVTDVSVPGPELGDQVASPV